MSTQTFHIKGNEQAISFNLIRASEVRARIEQTLLQPTSEDFSPVTVVTQLLCGTYRQGIFASLYDKLVYGVRTSVEYGNIARLFVAFLYVFDDEDLSALMNALENATDKHSAGE